MMHVAVSRTQIPEVSGPSGRLLISFFFQWRAVSAAVCHQMGKLFWWMLTSCCRLFEEGKQQRKKKCFLMSPLLYRQRNIGQAGRPPVGTITSGSIFLLRNWIFWSTVLIHLHSRSSAELQRDRLASCCRCFVRRVCFYLPDMMKWLPLWLIHRPFPFSPA